MTTSRTSRLALLALVALAGACQVVAPKVWVRGLVIDPDSLRPLAGVTVTGREETATTNADGRYELQVPGGVRELVFQAADRPAVKKFVVIDRTVDHRLDALLPTQKPDGLAIAVDRIWVFADDLRDSAGVESGPGSTLSVHDRYGNDDRFLRWDNDGVPGIASPRFSPDGRFLYFGLAVSERKAGVKAGVYRYELASNALVMLPRVGVFSVWSLAVTPDGSSLLASSSEYSRNGEALRLLVIHQPEQADARAEEITSPVGGMVREVLFDRSGAAYLVHDANQQGAQRSIRMSWPDLKLDASWADGGGNNLRSLVALTDGSVLGAAADGVYRRKPDGTLDKLVGEPLEPVGFDAARGVLYHRDGEGGDYHLHWRHLSSGLDLRIVSSADQQPGVRP